MSASLVLLLAGCQGAITPTPHQTITDVAASPGASASMTLTTPAPSGTPSVTASPGPSAASATASPSRSAAGTTAPAAAEVTIVTAGDIGRCDSRADDRTAKLAAGIPGTVLVLGDNAYEDGSRRDYAQCYDPSWGRLLDRTISVPGNHDHQTQGARAYFAYFGSRAGPSGRGWYARTLGAWRLITLDSECDMVGGCGRGSRQYEWLATELADHPTACTVVAFHRPRFSSGYHGDFDAVDPLWRLAVDAGADIVLNGHEHDYERLGPMDAAGRASAEGTRIFIVGTGGAPLRSIVRRLKTSKVRIDDRFGVLVLELADGAYRWAFRSTPDGSVEDQGSGACH